MLNYNIHIRISHLLKMEDSSMEKIAHRRIVVRPRLQEVMEINGFTQEQLSEKSGVSQPTISRFDASKMHQSRVLFALSAAIGCSVEDLFIIVEDRV